MNWRFKLSIRLALLRDVTAVVCLLAACSGDNVTTTNDADPQSAGQAEDLRHAVASVTITPVSPASSPAGARSSRPLRGTPGATR
jgi:hypothetical protein